MLHKGRLQNLQLTHVFLMFHVYHKTSGQVKKIYLGNRKNDIFDNQ